MNKELAISLPGKQIILNLTELIILLMLPLPFLKLNALYVITAVIIVLTSKFLRKEKWSDYGFSAVSIKQLFLAIVIGIVFGFIDNYLTEPVINGLTGSEPDLSSFEGVKGNISGLITMLALGWIVGGFFEESFFRGYIFYRFASIIKNPLWYRMLTVSVTSTVFGLAHYYQGISGIIGTLFFAAVISIFYFLFKRNIWCLILIHGFYDTVGIFRLYFSN